MQSILLRQSFLFLFLVNVLSASGQTLTISSTGETGSSGPNWSLNGSVLTVTGTADIQASVIVTALSVGSLSIEGNTSALEITINESITSTAAGNALSFGSSSNTGNITIGAAITNAGAVTMNGGLLHFGANVTTTSAGAGITLRAKTSITNYVLTTFTTQGGDVLLASNVDDATDGESTSNGFIRFEAGISISTNGGNITFGGGNTIGSDYAMGSSSTSNAEGIRLNGTVNIQSGGGNIVMRGKSYPLTVPGDWGGAGIGFYGQESGVINSGTGTIYLDGFSQTSGSTYCSGVLADIIYGWATFTLQSANTTADAIRIYGRSTGSSGDTFGLESNNWGTMNVLATGTGGGILIAGSTNRSNNSDIVFRSGSNILASSGPIRLQTLSGGQSNGSLLLGGAMYLGSKSGSAITSSSSSVELQFDAYSWSGTSGVMPHIATTGSVVWQPFSASFTNALSLGSINWNQNGQTMSGLIVGKSTSTANLTVNTALSVAGPITLYGGILSLNESLTSSAGGAISLYGNTLSFASGKTVTSNGGRLLVAPLTGSNTIGVAGASTGTYALPDAYFTTNFSDGFSGITIGSTNQTGDIYVRQPSNRDPLTFQTSGVLRMETSIDIGAQDLTLDPAMTFSGAPTYWIKTSGSGVVRRSIGSGSSFQFPIGNSTYNPLTILNNSGAADDFSARVADAVLTAGTTGTAITDKVVNRTWYIGKTNQNGGSGVNMTFQWDASEEVTNMTDYKLSHYGTFWAPASGTSGAVSGTATKTMTHTGYTGSFSPFAIGSTGSALPVSWVDFMAVRTGQTVELNWRTGTEQNTKDFVVQHSAGNGTWKNIGNVAAAGFSSSVRSYRLTHTQPVDGRNLYRLLQRDLDGKESLSKVVSVVMPSATSVQVYPVPTTNGSVFVKLPEDQVLKVFSGTGVLMLELQGKAGVQTLDLQTLPKGLYYLQAGKETIRVILQ